MSSGRYTRRGFAYQGRAFAGWARAGGAAVPTDPVAGWISETKERHWIAQSVTRLATPATAKRLWIAREDT